MIDGFLRVVCLLVKSRPRGNAISVKLQLVCQREPGVLFRSVVMTVGGSFCFEIVSEDKDLTNDEICSIVGVTLGA